MVGAQRAEVFTAAKITNAFSVLGNVVVHSPTAEFEWALYQGADRSSGYRLYYVSDASEANYELIRFSRKGSAVIDSGLAPVPMEESAPHKIEWRRAAGGVMTVALDGQEFLSIADQGIKTGFDGLVMANDEGDILFRDTEVRGAR